MAAFEGLLEALNAYVTGVNQDVPWEGTHTVRGSVCGGRPRIYVTKSPVEGEAVTVCVWEGPSGDDSEVTVRCMDGESFTGEVVMTAVGPCFRRNGDGIPFPAWGLREHILTPAQPTVSTGIGYRLY